MPDRAPGTTLPSPTRIKTGTPGVYLRGDRYQVWFKCSGCKPDGSCPVGHTETLPKGTLLRDAKARRAELVSKVAKGGGVVSQKTRLADYADAWLEGQCGNLAPKTVEVYGWAIKSWIKPYLGQIFVSELSVDHVARLVSRMKGEGRKAWTIRAVLTPLSRMMSHAVRGRLAASNPVRGLDKSERPKGDQRVMRILSSTEIERLLSPAPLEEPEARGDATVKGGSGSIGNDDLFSGSSNGKEKKPQPPLSDDWRTLITFLLFTGMRISEALNVRWEDIDFDAGTVTVTASKTRAGTGRAVILIPALALSLKRHRLRSRYTASQDRVFTNSEGGLLNRHYVLAKILKPALERAGVQSVTLHELRHTFASILIGQGFDITFVANQLGHSKPDITLRVYAQLYNPEARKAEAREKLQEQFGGIILTRKESTG